GHLGPCGSGATDRSWARTNAGHRPFVVIVCSRQCRELCLSRRRRLAVVRAHHRRRGSAALRPRVVDQGHTRGWPGAAVQLPDPDSITERGKASVTSQVAFSFLLCATLLVGGCGRTSSEVAAAGGATGSGGEST